MTSVYNLGCFAGALSTIFTGDWLGRPRQILLGSTIIAIGAVIQTASWTVPQVMMYVVPGKCTPLTHRQMMVGRVVAGLGTGMNTATAGVSKSHSDSHYME
jgi:MFS family permease